MKYEILLAGKKRVVELSRTDEGWIISLDGQELEASVAEVAPNTNAAPESVWKREGRRQQQEPL